MSINKSVLNFLRQLTTWHYARLPLRAVLRRGCCWPPARRRAAIDRYLLADGPTAANPQQLYAAAAWDRRTDRWRRYAAIQAGHCRSL